MNELLFFLCLPIVAFLYASVGHGGASGYLALLSLFAFAASDVKAIALSLNLFVASIAFIHYYRNGFFDATLFFPLAVASVPMAYVGGRIQLNTHIYFYILGLFLMLASIRLFFHSSRNSEFQIKKPPLLMVLLLGMCIGFVSGLLGIGGGIILSPILLFMMWAQPKETAGISALFICVNSAAGLAGQWSTGFSFPSSMWLIIVLAVGGGFAGAYLGAHRLPQKQVRQLLALVLFIASIKIFMQ